MKERPRRPDRRRRSRERHTFRPSEGSERGLGARPCACGGHGALKCTDVDATPEEDGKRGLPRVFVTRSHLRHESVPIFRGSRGRSSTPRTPAVPTTATAARAVAETARPFPGRQPSPPKPWINHLEERSTSRAMSPITQVPSGSSGMTKRSSSAGTHSPWPKWDAKAAALPRNHLHRGDVFAPRNPPHRHRVAGELADKPQPESTNCLAVKRPKTCGGTSAGDPEYHSSWPTGW
jgi:hypothetical protein